MTHLQHLRHTHHYLFKCNANTSITFSALATLSVLTSFSAHTRLSHILKAQPSLSLKSSQKQPAGSLYDKNDNYYWSAVSDNPLPASCIVPSMRVYSRKFSSVTGAG